MDDALILRRDRPVPRYTSYPTAPHFNRPPDARTLARWQREVPEDEGLSLYVHVPYCRELCWYCGCHTKITQRSEPVKRYAEALHKEIDLVADALGGRRPLRHLHFGGGTPSILAPLDLREIVKHIRERFRVVEDAEVAIEIDPRTLDLPRLQAVAACGFNRASLGVQDLDPRVQSAIGRIQPLWIVRTAVNRLREAGVRAINLDVIYGLPHQTPDSMTRTIEDLVALKPERFALFGYAHVPWAKPHQRLLEEKDLPDACRRFDLFNTARHALEHAGYVSIGLDHFALPGDPLSLAARTGTMRRNFQGYTDDPAETLIGLGPSSISQYREGFAQSPSAIRDWHRMVDAGELIAARGLTLSAEDRLRGAIIERLMCDLRVDLAPILAEHGAAPEAFALEFERLGWLAADGLVRIRGLELEVPEPMRAFVRVVAAVFDTYLVADETRHARAV